MTRLMELQCGAIGEARRCREDARAPATEAPRRARDFVRQADWLRARFHAARLPEVEGLVMLVERGAVESHDWSLTPDRHDGIPPEGKDKDFDFEEALRAIHIDLMF